MEVAGINMIPVYTTLFRVLHIPLPIVVVNSFGPNIAIATTTLAIINFVVNMLSQPNPMLSVQLPTVKETTMLTRKRREVLQKKSYYDFIIVGAGSAGSVIASRLSANGIYQVLLLEAGGVPLILNSIPAFSFFNIHHKETDWLFKTVPQPKTSFSSLNNRVEKARGKSLGGTSNLNFMVYARGNPRDLGFEAFQFRSDDYFECYLRHFTGTTWHPCCTAKMGRKDDPLAEVDSNLKVMQVKGLRIADTSIMPVITNANLNAPAIMIGESYPIWLLTLGKYRPTKTVKNIKVVLECDGCNTS